MPNRRNILIAALAFGLTLVAVRPAWAYIDPGTQSWAAGMLVMMLGSAGAFCAVLLWPFKRLLRWLRERIGRAGMWTVAVGVPVLLLAGAGWTWFALTHQKGKLPEGEQMTEGSYEQFDRVIVLGMDGLSPDIVEPMMDAGELPNFAKLRDRGSYSPLATTLPPETPVAWSGIATGCNPGKHGIFDFLHRGPSNYQILLSIYHINRKNLLDKRAERFLPVRHVQGFWTLASEAKIPTTVIRWPAAFPPEQVTGRFLSGLGVTDLGGAMGRYRFYTTDPAEPPGFKGVYHQADWKDDTFTSQLSVQIPGSTLKMDVVVRRTGDDAVSVQFGKSDAVELKVGQWSPVLPIVFRRLAGRNVPAVVRAHLGGLQPSLRLYVTTPQIDPADPYHQFTWPDGYAAELAKAIGEYESLGMPEDVNAMNDGVLPPEAFEQEIMDIFRQRKAQFDHEFSRFDKGLFAFVFDSGDRIQHMFWRTRDPGHPNYSKEFAEKFGHVIPDMYKRMDGVLGEVLAKSGDRTCIIVCSDHGFTTFRTKVGLNSWLVANGYMTLTTPDGRNGGEGFADVDWKQTRAYAVGFTDIYVNLKGREKQGIVAPGADCDRLCEELRQKLRDLREPVTGQAAVRDAYLAREEYRGDRVADGPDLVVGFNRGFRAESSNVIGGSPPQVFGDNMDGWSGDHLMDPHVVPGIFLSSRKLKSDAQPRNIDIAPSVLQCFKIRRPDWMDGQPLF
ncbi:MAG: hypothetical protein BIFFINMI_01062 [Phycisphaerae bacterium]|nr:hypothetical protein [Phycisphaerae bacterium]